MSDLPSTTHPDILPRLNPEYVAIHNAHMAHRAPPHTFPWHSDMDGQHCRTSMGGDRRLGVSTLNSFISRQCKAPENPYPAAVEDTNGKAESNANVNKIAVGGTCGGGNLAAIVCFKAQELTPPISMIFQLLLVPGKLGAYQTIISHLLQVTYNLSTPSVADERYPSAKECQNTVWLCKRANDVACNIETAHPFSDALLSEVPPALAFKLKSLGVKVEVKVYPRAPHLILELDAALKVGKAAS
ncbi:hypothetical protein EDB19DRAFT_1930265 [Suillus lakei]|nr:hypothetical protein EDB19DRAFT_1930265 [Suillus lakei]